MNLSLLTILLTPFFGGLLAYAGANLNKFTRNFFFILFMALPLSELYPYINATIDYLYYADVFSVQLILGINSFSFVAITIFAVIFLLAAIFMCFEFDKVEEAFPFLEFSFLEGCIFGVLLARDLLSFFIFFEIMTFLVFFLVQDGNKLGYKLSDEASIKYIVWALICTSTLLAAVSLLFFKVGNFGYVEIAGYLSQAQAPFVLLIFSLFAFGFLVEAAIMPFHMWASLTYTESPTSVSVVLSTVVKNVSICVLILFVFTLFGVNFFSTIMPTALGSSLVFDILQWLSAITIFISTFASINAQDMKKIIAWSSIAQGGFVLLGLSLLTPLGVTGGILHLINEVVFTAILFLAAGNVIYATQTKNLSGLGGLVKKMPITFLAMFCGIIATVGAPPLNGFASKYLIFEALLQANKVALFVVTLIGVVGSIFYSYKLIRMVFFGRAKGNYEGIKEVPILMRIPAIVLSVVALLFGVFPGITMKLVSKMTGFLQIEPISYNLMGFEAQTGLQSINITKISAISACVFLAILALFIVFSKVRVLKQASERIAKTFERAEQSVYDFFEKIAEPFEKYTAEKIYDYVADFIKKIGDYLRKIYALDFEIYIGLGVIFIVVFSIIYIVSILW
ncbi:MAG: hypothetical protein KBG49_12135 [Spirochaetes bacterium]|nr:hypothetical protein [Spirochaetota bacterium]